MLPPFTLFSLARTGGARAVRTNLAVAAVIALVAWALIRLTGSTAQWVALGIGGYSACAWAQGLARRGPQGRIAEDGGDMEAVTTHLSARHRPFDPVLQDPAQGLAPGNAAVEGVGHPGFVFRGGAGGNDAELAVDLHGIGVDDGAVQQSGKGDGQGGFAAGGRAGDQQGFGEGRGCHDDMPSTGLRTWHAERGLCRGAGSAKGGG